MKIRSRSSSLNPQDIRREASPLRPTYVQSTLAGVLSPTPTPTAPAEGEYQRAEYYAGRGIRRGVNCELGMGVRACTQKCRCKLLIYSNESLLQLLESHGWLAARFGAMLPPDSFLTTKRPEKQAARLFFSSSLMR